MGRNLCIPQDAKEVCITPECIPLGDLPPLVADNTFLCLPNKFYICGVYEIEILLEQVHTHQIGDAEYLILGTMNDGAIAVDVMGRVYGIIGDEAYYVNCHLGALLECASVHKSLVFDRYDDIFNEDGFLFSREIAGRKHLELREALLKIDSTCLPEESVWSLVLERFESFAEYGTDFHY